MMKTEEDGCRNSNSHVSTETGQLQWRKRKGIADVQLAGGEIVRAEVHWYEATGIGRREFKIKHLL